MSTKTSTEVTSSRGEQTRHRIMVAAEASFIALGYKGASLRNIATEAGVDIGLISYHFGSKDNLFRQTVTYCFGEAFRAQLAALESLPGGMQTVDDVLGAYSDVTMAMLEQEVKLIAAVRLARLRSQPDIDPQMAEFIRSHYTPVQEAYTRELQRVLPGHSPRAIRWAFNAFRFLYAQMLHEEYDELRTMPGPAREAYARAYLVRFCAGGFRALADADPA